MVGKRDKWRVGLCLYNYIKCRYVLLQDEICSVQGDTIRRQNEEQKQDDKVFMVMGILW